MISLSKNPSSHDKLKHRYKHKILHLMSRQLMFRSFHDNIMNSTKLNYKKRIQITLIAVLLVSTWPEMTPKTRQTTLSYNPSLRNTFLCSIICRISPPISQYFQMSMSILLQIISNYYTYSQYHSILLIPSSFWNRFTINDEGIHNINFFYMLQLFNINCSVWP